MEDQQRFLAYRDTLLSYKIPFEPERVTGQNYEIETGIMLFMNSGTKICSRMLLYAPMIILL